jgi:hypothetical protein
MKRLIDLKKIYYAYIHWISRLLQNYPYRGMKLWNVLIVAIDMDNLFVYYRPTLNSNTNRNFYHGATFIVNKVKTRNASLLYNTSLLFLHKWYKKIKASAERPCVDEIVALKAKIFESNLHTKCMQSLSRNSSTRGTFVSW